MAQQQLQCPFCPKTSSRGTGLASHIRGTHPAQYRTWKNNRNSSAPAARPVGRPPSSGFSKANSASNGGGLHAIVAQLEQQHSAILRALTALRDVEGLVVPMSSSAPAPAAPTAKRKGGMSPEGKQRLIAALKKRWAAKKKAAAKAAKA